MKKKLFLLNFFFMGISFMMSQITFQAVPQQKEAEINDVISVQFILSVKNKNVRDIGDMQLPTFINAHIVSRQFVQNRAYSNGDAVLELGYELGLKPMQAGVVKVGAAKIMVDGKLYQTQPFTIKINGVSNMPDDALGSETKSGEEAFLTLKLSNTNPYRNEEIIGQLKFYTRRVDFLNSSGEIIPPAFKGLIVQRVNENISIYQQEVVNGYLYYSKVIAQYVLFPTHTGSIRIEPFTLALVVSNGFFDENEINIKSEPVVITAKKLPENSPKDFYGVVGDYNLSVVPNRTAVNSGESVTVTVEVSGKGNLELVKTPALVVPKGIEQYPPKDKSKAAPTSEGMVGNMVSSNVLVPQTGGNFKIDVQPFVFFNPQTGSYKTLISKPIILKVAGDSAAAKSNSQMQEQNFSDNKDNLISNPKKVIETVWEGKNQRGLLMLISLSLLAFACLILIIFGLKKKKKTLKSQENSISIEEKDKEKSKQAKLQIAAVPAAVDFSSELQILNRLANEGKKSEFYTLLNSVLIKSASQNLQVPENTTSWEEIEEKLLNKYGQILSESWKELLLKSQIEKYSPVTEDELLVSTFMKSETVIKKLLQA